VGAYQKGGTLILNFGQQEGIYSKGALIRGGGGANSMI